METKVGTCRTDPLNKNALDQVGKEVVFWLISSPLTAYSVDPSPNHTDGGNSKQRGSISVWLMSCLVFLFGFSYFTYVEIATALLVWSNPNLSNRRSATQ